MNVRKRIVWALRAIEALMVTAWREAGLLKWTFAQSEAQSLIKGGER